MIRILITLLTISFGLPVFGQNGPQDNAQARVRIVARGDIVEISDGVSGRTRLREPLEEGDSLRTGPASFAVIDLDSRARLTMGPNSVVTLESFDTVPAIRLEQSRVRVQTRLGVLLVQSSVGDFLLSEAPAEAELELAGGSVSLQVISGGITMENVNAEDVVFRAPGRRAARSYQAGSIIESGDKEQSAYPYGPNGYGWNPNVYVGYPGLPYEFPPDTQPTENPPGRGRRR